MANPYEIQDSTIQEVAGHVQPANPYERVQVSGPAPAPAMPRFPAENTYMNSPAFQDILNRAQKGGVKSLSKDEQDQVNAAIKLYPQLAQAVPQEVDSAPEQGSGFYESYQKHTQTALKDFGSQMMEVWANIGDKPGHPLAKFGDAILGSLNSIGKLGGGLSPVSNISRELTGKLPSEWLSQAFGSMGLNPIERGQEPTGVEPGAETVSLNLVSGAVRLVPELLTGLVENPVGFATGLISFPAEEGRTLIQAAMGEKVATPEEVQKARDDIARHPEGVLMLGLMAAGAMTRVAKGKPAFESAKVAEEVKPAEAPKAEVTGAVKEEQVTPQAEASPPAPSKPFAITHETALDYERIPADLKVKVEAEVGKSGERVKIEQDGREALKEVDFDLDLAKRLKECLAGG